MIYSTPTKPNVLQEGPLDLFCWLLKWHQHMYMYMAVNSQHSVDYDVKPSKTCFASNENILIHLLILPVSPQCKWTIVLLTFAVINIMKLYTLCDIISLGEL